MTHIRKIRRPWRPLAGETGTDRYSLDPPLQGPDISPLEQVCLSLSDLSITSSVGGSCSSASPMSRLPLPLPSLFRTQGKISPPVFTQPRTQPSTCAKDEKKIPHFQPQKVASASTDLASSRLVEFPRLAAAMHCPPDRRTGVRDRLAKVGRGKAPRNGLDVIAVLAYRSCRV